MSGLFGALVDAARGRAAVLLPRPNPIFAPPDAPVFLVKQALDEADDADEARRVRRESPAAGRRGSARGPAGNAAEATVPEGGGESQEVRPRPRRAVVHDRGSDRGDAGTPSSRRLQPPEVADLIGPAVAGDRPRIETAPQVAAAASVERRDVPGFPPGEYPPLLPPLAEAPAGTPLRDAGREARLPGPTEPRGAAASAGEAGDSPRIDLRIGRIEIVAPAAPAAAKASARATIVPRARPRQSLDDYLSRRRR
jgi:hypothetical protein